MKYLPLVVLFLVAISAKPSAQAAGAQGQDNRGPAYCRDADIVCTTSQDVTQSNDVCVFKKYAFAVVFPNSDGKLYAFKNVALLPVAQGVYGAGETYSGNGFNLHIKTDVPASTSGTPSNLTTPSLNFNNLEMNCVQK